MFLLDIFGGEKRFKNRVSALRHIKKLSIEQYKENAKNGVEFIVSLSELKKIMDLLIVSEQKGTTLKAFEKALKNDSLDLPKKLTETIFRTVNQGVYQHCNWQDYEKRDEFMSNLLYNAISDNRTRENHFAIDGVVRNVNDSFWDIFYPPNGINCR